VYKNQELCWHFEVIIKLYADFHKDKAVRNSINI